MVSAVELWEQEKLALRRLLRGLEQPLGDILAHAGGSTPPYDPGKGTHRCRQLPTEPHSAQWTTLPQDALAAFAKATIGIVGL